MPNFQRKQIPFFHKGMNWNSPPDKLADGVPNWAKNVRVLQQGTISAAHGFTQRFNLPDRDFLHSMSRLNILNEQLDNAASGPAFDPNLSRTYVLGADYALYVFQDEDTLSDSQLNPVMTPTTRTLGPASDFSGNPLSIVDMQPVGAAVAWKYIGDSNQMVSVGYYPGDNKGQNMARCLQMGLDPPVFIGGSVQGNGVGTGNLLGNYQWAFVYRNTQTGARSNPSAATRFSVSSPQTPLGTTAGGGETVVLNGIPQSPIDPQTGLPDENIVVDIYRFGGNVQRWALIGTTPGGGPNYSFTFTDNTPDVNILTAPSPSQVTDASTGLTRFNLYRPFVTQDIARQGFAYVNQDPNTQVYYLTPAPGETTFNPFNPQWLPGSTIYLNNVACSIYQIENSQKLEIADDLTGTTVGVGTVDWSTPAGTLMSGQPLPHLWGPYGIGQSGSYLFACGDPNARGTLYWTNGNDPDSTDVVNNIVVTSPSEKLVTGCVYAGQPYVWSTERQFQIYPSLTIFGQFTTQEFLGAKGCWLEWSLSVQSNGVADQSVTWRGKDGIYDLSSNGLQRLSDPLYAFFPHDNQPSIAPETLITQISSFSDHPEHVGNLDDTQPQYHRITWFQGLMFYDFVALSESSTGPNTFSTLVWDTVNIPGGGWVSLDQPFDTTAAPVCRCIELGANAKGIDDVQEPGPIYGPMMRGGNMLVLRSKDPSTASPETYIYDYYGYTRGFEARVITKAEDMGDSRAPKVFGDYWVDCTPINSIGFYPLGDFNVAPLLPSEAVPGTVPGPPDQRQQFIFDFQEFLTADKIKTGESVLTTTLGLDVRWIAADGQFTETINQWSPSYVLKPEFIEFRASDPEDAGATQAKYLMGFNLEANTQGIDEILGVIIDDQMIAQLRINHPTQSIKPYAWEPVAGYEFQVRLQLGPGMNALQIFKINWIFEPWPDNVARKYPFNSYGDVSDKFIQGVVLPMETGGVPCTVGLWSDDTNLVQQWTKTTLPLKKTGVVLNIEQPFTAHFLQFQTITPGRIWPNEAKVVWEPIPELSNTWQTQETDFDMGGWSHLRDCFVAYMGGDGSAPTLYITDEYETVSYLLDPVQSGQFTRCYRVLKPMKAKWHSFRLEGGGPGVRLYVKDTVFRAKEWGSGGPYVNIQPFGDLSRTSGARM